MTSGAFVNADDLLERAPNQSLREKMREREFLYYKEGIDGIVCVEQTETERILVINGKHDASSQTDLPTQVLLGQIPMLMHPDPQDVLVIGLGSGITVGSTAVHDSATRIDVLEISPEVVAASEFFAASNGDVLSDPRVNLIVADARNYILSESKTYDVITSEPSNPWISGISNLFTQDFFELARARLAPGGVMAQWLETYNMSSEDVRIVFRTFQSVFPHMSAWMPMLGDLILIGTEKPHTIDYTRIAAAAAHPRIRADLRRIEMDDPSRLLSAFLMGSEQLAAYAEGSPRNTDSRPRIEFNAPRNLYMNTAVSNLSDILRSFDRSVVEIPVSKMARRSPVGIEAPALGLIVRTDAVPAGEDWSTLWIIERHLSISKDGGLPELIVGSRRLLLLSEGETQTQVQASTAGGPSSAQEQLAILESVLAGPGSRTGEADLPSGATAQWAAHPDTVNDVIRLALTWISPSESGTHTRYVVTHNREDPGEGGWESTVMDLARRFEIPGPDDEAH
jgi:spermidine synthase